MLDSIVYNERNFVSKYHIEEIKSIIKPVPIVKAVMKAFCILPNQKPVRKGKADGSVELDYTIDS